MVFTRVLNISLEFLHSSGLFWYFFHAFKTVLLTAYCVVSYKFNKLLFWHKSASRFLFLNDVCAMAFYSEPKGTSFRIVCLKDYPVNLDPTSSLSSYSSWVCQDCEHWIMFWVSAFEMVSSAWRGNCEVFFFFFFKWLNIVINHRKSRNNRNKNSLYFKIRVLIHKRSTI